VPTYYATVRLNQTLTSDMLN